MVDAPTTAMLRPGEETSWSLERKLASAAPELQLPELLGLLWAAGFEPRVAFTWRSLLTQAWLLEQGRTQVTFSFHNVVDSRGRPRALAADLFDVRYGWGDDRRDSEKTRGAARFFAALGEAAEQLGLHWGGHFSQTNLWAHYGMGWDPAHIQAVPNAQLSAACTRSLRALYGRPRIAQGSGGYVYGRYANGYIRVVRGPAAIGRLLLPGSAAFAAVDAELQHLAGGSPRPLQPHRLRRRSA